LPDASRPVTIVVVSFNTKSLLRECLASLGAAHQVIVVDNASQDGSPKMVREEFPLVELIANSDNRGFGSANNQGLAQATHDRVLLLNPDARAEPGAIETLAQALDDPGVAAAGGRLLSSDGSTQNSCSSELTLWAVLCEQTMLEKAFPHSPRLSPYWLTPRLIQQGSMGPFEVEQVMGACLMVRPEARFDERFFLYCEDTELCYRLRRQGKILYVPEARFHHDLGASSARMRWRSVARYNFGKTLYFFIHHGLFSALLCEVLNRMGALFRVILGLVGLILGVLTVFLMGFGPRLIRWSIEKLGTFCRVLVAGRQDPRPRRPRPEVPGR